MSEAETDEYWLERYLAGEASAFDQLVRRTQNRLFASILRIVGSRDEAMDVLQETYLKVFRNISKFERGCSFSTWVYRIAINQAISHRRKRRMPLYSQNIRDEDDHSFEPEDPESKSSSLDRMLLEERNSHVMKALNELPPAQRAVLVMCDYDDLRYDEIAEVLGVPIGTVRSRIHRAREELRSKLQSVIRPDQAVEDAESTVKRPSAGRG